MTKRFHIEPTSLCQLGCPLCPTQRFNYERKGIMDFKKFVSLVDDAVSSGYMLENDEVHLYGYGEPLLNNRLVEMISLLNSYGLKTKINTNGILLDEKKSSELSDSGLTKLLLSLDGINELDYQKYRKNGDFNKIRNNLLKIKAQNKRNYILEIQFILFEHNFGKEEEFIQFGVEMGCDFLVLKKPRVWYKESCISKANHLIPNNQVTRNTFGKTCSFGEDMGMICFNGNLTICNSDPFCYNVVGNIFNEGVQIWDSDKFKEKRNIGKHKKTKSCIQCSYDDRYSKKIKLN
ncbi:MAG: radical SAM protein [Nanoarchaeota archaeon]